MEEHRKRYWLNFAWLFVMMTVFALISRSVLVFVAGVVLATIGAWKIRRDVEGRGFLGPNGRWRSRRAADAPPKDP
ncbi:MAG: hypothetical protein ABL966_09640 [Acidimicrobiales bacterium]